ncbi:MAG TPA: hypothetical protein V6C81_27045 [Planktothrix sp.]
MIEQKLYDLIVEADAAASDIELDQIAFILEGFPNIEWLRQLIKEDAVRLSPLMEPPAEPLNLQFALLRCADYREREGFTGRIADLLCRQRTLFQSERSQIERKKRQSSQPLSSNNDSLPQRIYNLITAADVVETELHLQLLGNTLRLFEQDVLDLLTLTQDAPRLRLELKKVPPKSDYGLENKTFDSDFHTGLCMFSAKVRSLFGTSLWASIETLLSELFAQYGLDDKSTFPELRAARETGRTPNTLKVERRGPRQSYPCVYVWMIEDNIGRYGRTYLDKPLVQSAKVWDQKLVETFVQPCVKNPNEKLLKLIVCVANSQDEAKQLAEEYNRSWRLFSAGHLSEQMSAREARHVILLEEEERSRAVFVWGTDDWYTIPGSPHCW